jgi:hypothetical protein
MCITAANYHDWRLPERYVAKLSERIYFQTQRGLFVKKECGGIHFRLDFFIELT